MRGLDRQLEGDDDDIIDLEDIIEMPDRPIDEEEDLDLGVDIFDVDEGLQSTPFRSARKSAGLSTNESSRELDDVDLLDSLEADEDDLLFEPAISAPKEKFSAPKARPSIFDEEEESILDDFLAEPVASEPLGEETPDLKARAEAAMRVAEEEWPQEAVSASPSEAVVQAEPAATESVAGASISEISAAAEELIGRIESRLQEHIRVVVESMLPGLVRSILDEEISKLKKELE
ncbi:MAG: hypothetical protein P4L55_06700 [Syntrophobacteraceae bacterium]|nr:hypothetical protein [Syntrophobacteraceae bacterium]